MVRDVKGKGKTIIKGIKEVDDLEQRIKNLEAIFSHLRDKNLKQKEVVVKLEDDKSSDDDTSKDSQDYLSEDSNEDLINFLSSRDPQWQFPKQSHEEDPLPIDVPMQTEEEDPLSLEIVYPIQEIASSSSDTSRRGGLRYGLRSLGPIQEEVVMVKDGYSGSSRKRNS
ncbi:hypothetical protein Tco_0373979 [Tanacetum coccineum]